MKKNGNQSLDEMINKFLRNYRNLPCTDKNFIPSHKVFAFVPRTKLELIKRTSLNPIGVYREKQKTKSVKFKPNIPEISGQSIVTKIPSFSKGEDVLYRLENSSYVKWLKARIVRKESSVIYSVLVNGLQKLAHVNQLRKTILKKKVLEFELYNACYERIVNNDNELKIENELEMENESNLESDIETEESSEYESIIEITDDDSELSLKSEPILRRSKRNRKKPNWFLPEDRNSS